MVLWRRETSLHDAETHCILFLVHFQAIDHGMAGSKFDRFAARQQLCQP
jgi:hypothetical protein